MGPEREIGRAATPIPVTDTVVLVLLALVELAAVVAVVALWREQGRSRVSKLFWTATTLVPVVGLVVFFLLHDPPPPNGPTDRPPRRYWDP